ncbi:MAG: type IX secretion system membrane protein PorP/SprF [Sphingobacteriales bacterium]|nr:MAG: type IX secretion system membrane protein PorP/SprF [Sphingobacteriales bacterium]
MKTILKLVPVVCLAVMMSETTRAQDIHFSQFYENAILRNPALTGIFSGDYKAGVNFRNQWSTISAPYQTILASVETRINVNEDVADYLSFGLTATYDKAGSINFSSMQLYPAVNFNKSLEDVHQSYLSAGFTAGYVQRSVDPSKMTFSSQYSGGSFDPGAGNGENMTNTKLAYMDIGAGLSFNSSIGEYNNINYYIGAAAFHINKPKAAFVKNESFMRMEMKWNGNMGFHWQLHEQVGITTHVNYSKQGKYQELIGGALVGWRNMDPNMQSQFTIYAGMFYRNKDAIIPTMKLDYKQYSFTVSYDINSSSLKTASNGMGGMEISVFTRGYLTKGIWKQDKTKCPRFEQMIIPNF